MCICTYLYMYIFIYLYIHICIQPYVWFACISNTCHHSFASEGPCIHRGRISALGCLCLAQGQLSGLWGNVEKESAALAIGICWVRTLYSGMSCFGIFLVFWLWTTLLLLSSGFLVCYFGDFIIWTSPWTRTTGLVVAASVKEMCSPPFTLVAEPWSSCCQSHKELVSGPCCGQYRLGPCQLSPLKRKPPLDFGANCPVLIPAPVGHIRVFSQKARFLHGVFPASRI